MNTFDRSEIVKQEVRIMDSKNTDFFGRMNAPDASAFLKGPCGDEMEFYLVIDSGIVKDIKYYTDGCDATRACGELAARSALGREVYGVLDISAGEVLRTLKDLPPDHKHCAILAVSCLYRAIADYLLRY